MYQSPHYIIIVNIASVIVAKIIPFATISFFFQIIMKKTTRLRMLPKVMTWPNKPNCFMEPILVRPPLVKNSKNKKVPVIAVTKPSTKPIKKLAVFIYFRF